MKEEETRIDRLKKELYSRKNEDVMARSRRDLHERDFGAPEEWILEEEEVVKKKLPILKILLVTSVVFFVGSAAISSFFLFSTPAISPQNVEIEIQGPATIGGGEELGLQITITNRNPVSISLVDLIVEYPDGTRATNDINKELRRHREALGTIVPGDRVRRTVRSVLFGKENSIRNIKVIVEYRVESSNAIFFNEANYQLALSTSPLSLVVETLKEAISGQDVKFTATITSNSKDVIKNVLLQVEYPFGFEFKFATPKPEFADRLWYLGDIPPEGEKKIEFGGTLVGQDGEERIFRFATGIQSETDPNGLGATFINISETLLVKRPFITIDLALDGDTEDNFVARPSGEVRADIFWTNNLPTQIFDGEIEVKFKGDVIDKRTIIADKGFYQSVTNKILWDRQTNSSLATIPSGQSDQVSFTFTPLSLASGISFRNPQFEIDVRVRGKRLSDASGPLSPLVPRDSRLASQAEDGRTDGVPLQGGLRAQAELLRSLSGHRTRGRRATHSLRTPAGQGRRDFEQPRESLLRRCQHSHARQLVTSVQSQLLQVHERDTSWHRRRQQALPHQVGGGLERPRRRRRI